MQEIPGKVPRCNFFADSFREWKDSLGTNIEHVQSRCMVGSANKPSFLAILCSSACARLLVHVRCPLTYIVRMEYFHVFARARRQALHASSPKSVTPDYCYVLEPGLCEYSLNIHVQRVGEAARCERIFQN